ncbi:syndecan-1 [Heteronotia binoei]|uniref:syndecan-1 n=1 Tax=Heteronotia binoei TaxID=13085 RepID=UPI00292EDA5F|nr:syndecan-1 [Heteronotia binoei]
MAKLIRARVLLCALVFGVQAVLAQTTDFNFPPEDLDSSGDDDDSFSGSGAGSLPSVVAWDIPLQGSINTSSSPSAAPDVEDHEPEAQGTETPSEDYQRIPVSPTNMHVLLVNDLVTDKPVVSVEEEVDMFTEQATTSSAVVTARVPVTHHTSTLRITTSYASSTVGILEPEVYHNVYHEVSSSDIEGPANDIVPTIHSLDATSSTTTSLVFIKNTSSQPEEDILSPEDGSGDQGDFTFGGPGEKTENRAVEELGTESRALGPGTHDTKSAGASQGLMDRKDVLAGVIAGGLVGLLFAAFLVGFMLYRMKKKDEGSYSLDEPKQSNGGYQKPHKQEEFYA